MSSASATVRVEKATSDLLIGPDWTMNMDICDSINTEQGQAKDVVKAIKKRLQHKSPKVHFLALTLLETMIKNCGDFVHFQVADRGVLQEMIKIVRKRTDMQVRDKILVLLDSWQEAFGGPGGRYPQYYWAYTELKRSGVEFPQRSPDSALILTPGSHLAAAPRHPQIGYGMPSNSSLRLDEAMASEMANLSLSDLDRYRSVMELLSDMLKAVNPGDREAVKDEVIVDLVGQCRSNQKKLMEHINSTGDEELLGEGLSLNDALQTLLAKHDAIASGSPLPAESSQSKEAESIPGPKTPVAPTPAVANRYEEEDGEEDDDFAQLARRNSRYKQAAETTSEKNGLVASPNHSDDTNITTGSTSEASSSVGCNALALPDPPAPVRTSNKEQDMIDLLSITLASNSPPHTPVTPASTSFQRDSYVSDSPNGTSSPYAPQQPYRANQGYMPYNSYVAPWAQAQTQPQPPQVASSYVPPPWETTTGVSPNPFIMPSNQFAASAVNSSASYAPVYAPRAQHQYIFPQPQHQYISPQQQQQQYNSAQPHQQYNSAQPPQQQQQQHNSAQPHQQYNSAQPHQQYNSAQPPPQQQQQQHNSAQPHQQYNSAQPQQQYSSFGPQVNNVPAATAAIQGNVNLRQTGYGASPKPYVSPDKLFEELIDLRTTDKRVKQSSSSPSQGMVSGRK